MENRYEGQIDIDPNKFVVYKHKETGILLALKADDAEILRKLSHKYEGGYENVPSKFTQQFYILRFNPQTNVHSLTDETKEFRVNEVDWIFIKVINL